MSNVIFPEVKPKNYSINSPVYQHYVYGWDTPNSSFIRDCVPTWTNPCPSHQEKNIGTLEDAIKKSIYYMDERIRQAEKLKSEMEQDLLKLRNGK